MAAPAAAAAVPDGGTRSQSGDMRLRWPRPLRRLPLRARVVGAFTLGAMLAAFLLVVMTYSLSRGSMLGLRQDSSEAQFFANATQVQGSLRAESPDFAVLLESLPSLSGSRSIVRTGPDIWRSPSLVPSDLPDEFVDAVERSEEAHAMRYRLDGVPQLALGLRLRPSAVSQLSETLYFEVVPLSEIEATLASLRLILGVGAALTVLIGVAVGAWAGGTAVATAGNGVRCRELDRSRPVRHARRTQRRPRSRRDRGVVQRHGRCHGTPDCA